MTYRSRLRDNRIKAMMLLCLSMALTLRSCIVAAQSRNFNFYRGLEVSFGTRVFNLNSNIPQLASLSVLEEGGNAGIVAGGNILRAKLHIAGFFYSASKVGRTIDLFETEGLVNFYPAKMAGYNGAVQPYLVGGIGYNNIKFFGYYLNRADQKINYSDTREPYLGKISLINCTVGIGLECRILETENNFVNVFGEARCGKPLMQKAGNADFQNTSVQKYSSINIGLNFGGF